MATIAKNHDDWTIPTPPLTPKKRGIIFQNPEDMQEAKRSIKEKDIKSQDVKNLPPIEILGEPTTHPPMVEVHSLHNFTVNDIPYSNLLVSVWMNLITLLLNKLILICKFKNN